ncbi:MAG: hypothetical protein NTW21_08185, partial [Verrucomicrobia bacterium]|nr:hypothetical protein [Verrucomicrobiota bacterium]
MSFLSGFHPKFLAANRSHLLLIGIALAGSSSFTRADATYHSLASGPFTQNWSNAGLITTDDNWSGVPGIVGYRGDDLTAVTGTDPRTVTAESMVVDVNANQTAPNTLTTGGVTEFALADPVVALAGSNTADAPYIQIHLDTTGTTSITVQYNLRGYYSGPPVGCFSKIFRKSVFFLLRDADKSDDLAVSPARISRTSQLMA